MDAPLGVDPFRSRTNDDVEATDTPREIAEAALAHTIGNAAELAYLRGDALETRRILMEAWAELRQTRPLIFKWVSWLADFSAPEVRDGS